jgi:hypothetical protein
MSLRGGSRGRPAKRRRLAPIPDELGKLIDRDLKLFNTLGWEALITAPWTTPQQCADSITHGPHKSAYDHVDSLRTEFTAMVNKAQWLILPY